MKKMFTFFALAAVMSSFTTMVGMDDVVAALKKGNASQVARYFDNTVEITLPEKSNSYSRTQAETILRDFFRTKAVKGFDVIHMGDNGGTQYCIGTLFTSTATYRTTLFMKQKANKQALQEIRFENR